MKKIIVICLVVLCSVVYGDISYSATPAEGSCFNAVSFVRNCYYYGMTRDKQGFVKFYDTISKYNKKVSCVEYYGIGYKDEHPNINTSKLYKECIDTFKKLNKGKSK